MCNTLQRYHINTKILFISIIEIYSMSYYQATNVLSKSCFTKWTFVIPSLFDMVYYYYSSTNTCRKMREFDIELS